MEELAEDAAAVVATVLGAFEGTSAADGYSEGMNSSGSLPLVLWGHSVGAFVALRLGQLLSDRSIVNIMHLIISQCRAPQIQSEFNESVHTVKLHKSHDRDVLLRLLSTGMLPTYMDERIDMLRSYSSIFRAGGTRKIYFS